MNDKTVEIDYVLLVELRNALSSIYADTERGLTNSVLLYSGVWEARINRLLDKEHQT